MRDTENELVGWVSSFGNKLLCTCFRARTSELKGEDNEVVDHPDDGLASVLDTQKAKSGPVSPGIVARLMGLESLPEPSLVPKYRPIDLFLPRRSADSINNPPRFDPLVHRQVGTSLSFRDMPTYLQDDVKEFFLTRAENIWQKKIQGSRNRKYDITGGAVKQSVRGKKLVLNEAVYNENDYMRMLVTGRPFSNSVASTSGASQLKSDSRKHITATDRITFPKKHTGRYLLPKEKTKPRSEPEAVKRKIDLSAKEISRERPRKQKKQPDPPQSVTSPRRGLNVNSLNKKRQIGCDRSPKSTKSVCNLKPKGSARKLVKEDLQSLLSEPKDLWKQVTLEEIVTEFGAKILEGLVYDVVAELWGLHMNNFTCK